MSQSGSVLVQQLLTEIKKVMKGKDDVILKIIMSILASGHVLLEDNPGLGKTTVAKALSRAMSLDVDRIQFTPDTMPSDIVGYSIFDTKSGEMHYKKGPVFTNILLADEINRTSSKTQAALLEAMAEGTVSTDEGTEPLPNPFITIATQNPITSGGTQALPDSQLDRFMVKLSMGYPDVNSQIEMLMEDNGSDPMKTINPVINKEQLIELRSAVARTTLSFEMAEYLSKLIDETRNHKYIACGISPRGAKAFANMTKASAFLNDRSFVVPGDVAAVIYDVFSHRLVLTMEAKRENITPQDLINEIMRTVSAPSIVGEPRRK